MESDEGKLFVGGVAWDTTEDSLANHFSKFGEVNEAVIMRDKVTGRPRGFAFVVFSDPSVIDRVLLESHSIDGRTVEAKRALSREEQQSSSRGGNFSAGRNSGEGGNFRTKKIFVGGLPSTLTEDQFLQYFENYGRVTDVVIMYDQSTQRPRGFGFITFESEDSVDGVLQKTFHDLDGKSVEVKRALPKDANPGGGSRMGGYQGFGASSANSNTFDSQMDRNRYVQPQTTGGGFPPYPGYMIPGFGYGAYGSYGVGGYGNSASGFGSPYGNQNTPNAAYVGGTPGVSKNAWSNQVASGYGASGYGANASYGYTAPWSIPGGAAAVSAPRGRSGSAAYPSHGYGYGYAYGYGGNEGSDGSYSGGHVAGNGGISGGEQQEFGSDPASSGYGDTLGKPGYSSESYPSQSTDSYGGGFSSSQSRRA